MLISSQTCFIADFGISFLSSVRLHRKQNFWVEVTDFIVLSRLLEIVDDCELIEACE